MTSEHSVVEAIAKLLWERFSPEHEVEWPCSHAAEYRDAAAAIVVKLPQDAQYEAVRFLYKHGDLTHSAAQSAIDLLTNNGFVVSNLGEGR